MFNNLLFFVEQMSFQYVKHSGCPWHVVMNDVDIEDIADYFHYIVDEKNHQKQKKLMDSFEGL